MSIYLIKRVQPRDGFGRDEAIGHVIAATNETTARLDRRPRRHRQEHRRGHRPLARPAPEHHHSSRHRHRRHGTGHPHRRPERLSPTTRERPPDLEREGGLTPCPALPTLLAPVAAHGRPTDQGGRCGALTTAPRPPTHPASTPRSSDTQPRGGTATRHQYRDSWVEAFFTPPLREADAHRAAHRAHIAYHPNAATPRRTRRTRRTPHRQPPPITNPPPHEPAAPPLDRAMRRTAAQRARPARPPVVDGTVAANNATITINVDSGDCSS
jgi:hypothetical protein